LGWSIVYNHHGYFDQVIDHLGKQSMILLHPCSLVQASLPKILAEVPASHLEEMNAKLKISAELAFERFSKIPGIKPVKSSAAMYMMVRIDPDAFDIANDVDFCTKLLEEQNAFCLPGACFSDRNMFRIITCCKPETIQDFADRLQTFCLAHSKQ
jgi:tyrosine aminotransferase